MKTSRATSKLWKKLGFTVGTQAEATFLYGVEESGVDNYRHILSEIELKSTPLDWDYPFSRLYVNEQAVLWVRDPEGKPFFLPQVVVINPVEALDEKLIRIKLLLFDFRAPLRVEVGLGFYRRNADGTIKKRFFDGLNARLVDWDVTSSTLVFQGCFYHDYCGTNLSLDAPLPEGDTLREYSVVSGRLKPLRNSELANATGLNGLLFSNDGFMIIQKRSDNVLVRPGELCSGFSGTVDKEDVIKVIEKGGFLENLDILREMVEELGVSNKEVIVRRFLGLTRELVRGGTPEMFYSVDVDLPADIIVSRISKDKEGAVIAISFEPYASSLLTPSDSPGLPQQFWSLIEQIQAKGNGPISVPLLTNLVLWYQSICPTQVGVGAIPRPDH